MKGDLEVQSLVNKLDTLQYGLYLDVDAAVYSRDSDPVGLVWHKGHLYVSWQDRWEFPYDLMRDGRHWLLCVAGTLAQDLVAVVIHRHGLLNWMPDRANTHLAQALAQVESEAQNRKTRRVRDVTGTE